jgi:lactoylglutathione lyase
MADHARDLAVRYVESWNLDPEHGAAALEALVSTDYVDHAAADGQGQGLEAARALEAALRAAFSEVHFEIQDVISDGEKVVVRGIASGRHSGDGGPMGGMPVTGRRFAVAHIHIFRVRDGKLAEHWACRDDLGQLAQLGLLPGPR